MLKLCSRARPVIPFRGARHSIIRDRVTISNMMHGSAAQQDSGWGSSSGSGSSMTQWLWTWSLCSFVDSLRPRRGSSAEGKGDGMAISGGLRGVGM